MLRTVYVLAGALGAMLLLAAVGMIVVYSGAYDVAATSGHGGIGRWALHEAMRSAVERRAPAAPEEAGSPAAIAAGAGEYQAMCETCHGGPGVSSARWARDIEPVPPDLAHAAEEWNRGEIFWIVSHGVKMTGMPAFGPTHDAQTIWNIAAFVERLPSMSAEEYAAYRPAAEGHDGQGADAHGGNGHSH